MAISDKLTYLNTTKGKIKDSINITGANIGTNDTFRSYSTKLKDGIVDMINNGTEAAYNNFPKVTGTGSDITLNNTYNSKLKVDLKGNTHQDSYTGKNLFDYTLVYPSVNGLTSVVNSDNSITTTGIQSNSYVGIIATKDITNILENGQTYTVYVDNKSNLLYLQVKATRSNNSRMYYATINSNSVSFTVNKSEFVTYEVDIMSGDKTNWGSSSRTITNRYMLCKGTNTTFEPYVGGTPSPNPNYPQNIEVVTGYNNIAISDGTNSQSYEVNLGKNLLEPKLPTTSYKGITCTNNGDGTFTLNGTAEASADFRLDQSARTGSDNLKTYNGTYTLSCNELQNGMSLRLMQVNTWDVVGKMENNNTPVTFITNKENVFTYVYVFSGTTLNNLVIRPQIEKGTQATSFSPYKTPIEMCKIGEYQDEIRKSTGKNLFDKDNATSGTFYNTNDGSIISSEVWSQSNYIEINNTNYLTLSSTYKEQDRSFEFTEFNSSKQWISSIQTSLTSGDRTFELNNNTKYIKIGFRNDRGEFNIQLEEGNTSTDFEPYGVGVWYKYNRIGKVVLDGSENGWEIKNTGTNNWYYQLANQILINAKTQNNQLSNYYLNAAIYNGNTDQGFYVGNSSYLSNRFIRIRYGTEDTIANYKNWLSTHNLIVYYPLLITSITTLDTELQTQLEDIYNNAKSYLGQTNITANYISGNQPFIMNTSALLKEE